MSGYEPSLPLNDKNTDLSYEKSKKNYTEFGISQERPMNSEE